MLGPDEQQSQYNHESFYSLLEDHQDNEKYEKIISIFTYMHKICISMHDIQAPGRAYLFKCNPKKLTKM